MDRPFSEVANSVITAVEHRGIVGALTCDFEADPQMVWARIIIDGVPIQSEPAKFDMFERCPKVQANWDAAVDAYLEAHPA